MSNYKQGVYEVKNKDKYLGTKNPRYLSSYELRVFQYLDTSPHVIKWGAEVVVIPYYSPVDEANRRYMVDIYVEYKKPNGKISKELIEIKPSQQTKKPRKGKRKKEKTYLKELYTYNVNIAKWMAAKKYAEERGWKFRLLTEENIFL